MTDRKTELLPTAYALRLANSWARGGVCSMREGDAQRYHAACAAALHEKWEREERSRGCSVCDSIHASNTLDGFLRMGYNFCPMCGRKLKED